MPRRKENKLDYNKGCPNILCNLTDQLEFPQQRAT